MLGDKVPKEAFYSEDHNVINVAGDNYYRACDEFVHESKNGTRSHCVKRKKHPGNVHEDYFGRTREG